MEVYVDDETKLTLHGLKQHYVRLEDKEKNRKLLALLDDLEINQVVIFLRSVQRADMLCRLLTEQMFPATAIHRGLKQPERCVVHGCCLTHDVLLSFFLLWQHFTFNDFTSHSHLH